MENDSYTHHISQQFNEELESVKTHMLEMGGRVERQVTDAISAFMRSDSGLGEKVRVGDDEVNAQEVAIEEECTIILARRQPAASDLRLVLAVTKTLNDLERIGDEASKIAEHAIKLSEEGELPRGVVEIRHIGGHVTAMLSNALDAFARLDVEAALKVAQEDHTVDSEYASAMRSLVTYMMEDPRSISTVLNVMWALRSLERVGDHARNIAEHLIYLVKGENVSHVGLKELAKRVKSDD